MSTRAYDMRSRDASVRTTRERIVDAACELFLAHWYDDVTLALIAEHAGVSGQTVINHFGGKEPVFAAAIERLGEEVENRRYRATPGDVDGALAALLEDYEITGDAVIRLLAVEERLPAVQPPVARGREGHRAWLETMFGAVTPELLVATDVYTWKLLRRDQGLSPDETAAVMRRLVDAALAAATLENDDTARRSA